MRTAHQKITLVTGASRRTGGQICGNYDTFHASGQDCRKVPAAGDIYENDGSVAKMKFVEKGNFGYTNSHKKEQMVKTFIYFLLPIAIFILGYVTTKSAKNLFTVVAVVGALPACKELVNVIMFWRRRSMPAELYEELSSHVADGMEAAYELIFTTYEKNYVVPCVVVAGSQVIGYMVRKDLDSRLLEEHLSSTLKKNGLNVHVHIFRDLKSFLDRVDVLAEREPEDTTFTPDERYPELNREQLTKHLLLALSL